MIPPLTDQDLLAVFEPENYSTRRFEQTIVAFGPLPKSARSQLERRLRFAHFRAARPSFPSPEASRLASIVKAIRRLQTLLRSPPEFVFINERYAAGLAELKGSHLDDELDDLAQVLQAFEHATQVTASRLARKKVSHRGGAIRTGRKTVKTQFLEDIFSAYHDTRKSFPKSGPPIAFDASLKNFTTQALRAAGFPSANHKEAIRGAFRRWMRTNQIENAE